MHEVVDRQQVVQGQEQQGRHRGDEERLPAQRRPNHREQYGEQQELGQVEEEQPEHQPRPAEFRSFALLPLPYPALREVHLPGGQVQHHQREQRPGQAHVGPAQERTHPVHPQQHREQGQQAHGHERRPERGRRQQHPEHGQEPGLAAKVQAEQGIQSGSQDVQGRQDQVVRLGVDPQEPPFVNQGVVPGLSSGEPVGPPLPSLVCRAQDCRAHQARSAEENEYGEGDDELPPAAAAAAAAGEQQRDEGDAGPGPQGPPPSSAPPVPNQWAANPGTMCHPR